MYYIDLSVTARRPPVNMSAYIWRNCIQQLLDHDYCGEQVKVVHL